MEGKGNRSPRPGSKRPWSQRKIALWTLFVLTATFVVGYIVVPVYLNRGKSEGAQGGNTVTGATSSAVVQGGNVGNLTINNYQPSPTPTPTPSPTPTPTPAPAPAAVSRVEPAFEPAPPPTSVSPSPERRTESFVRLVDQCARANYRGAVPPGGQYADTDVGFYVKYEASSEGGAGGPTAWLALRMPGEPEPRRVMAEIGHSPSITTKGCLYTFTVLEVTGGEVKFTFRGQQRRATAMR